ncbi:MAG: hypothetical protein DWH81_13815 [Planctomycetota bacterium]|nr:MAG: hypothetical protein DWH81_13815 [Planctomycetota bacterium]
MMARWILTASLLLVLACAGWAAITPTQKKQIVEVSKSLTALSSHLRKKEYTEADELLKTAETRIEEIAKEAGIETTDKAFQSIHKKISDYRKNLDKAQGKAVGVREKNQGVSFTKQVAPLINDKCIGCHGPSAQSGGLRLDTFASWKKGSKTGPLLTPKSPQQSLILYRLAPDDVNFRMPKDDAGLTKEQISIIAKWVAEGAMFDGESEEKALASLRTKVEAEETDAKIKIVKAKGTEKVSFTRDIAPFMANLCLRCHSGQEPRGGLSLETFYDMMRGGQSGIVVLPGEPKEKSRLFRLTGGLENPRMPNGDEIRLTRKNYDDLVTWFEEGCVFDGPDPKAPLRSFVKSDAEQAKEMATKISPAEFNTLRKEKSLQQFSKALPQETATTLESDELLIIGNVPEPRLKQVEAWAKEHVAMLRKGFGGTAGPIWKGRLAVFVMKDRFGYEEFSLTVNGRPTQERMQGHLVISPTLEDAYIVLEDVGDQVTPKTPGLRVNLIDQLTGAYLKRTGADLPNWMLRGTGLSMALKVAGRNPYLDAMRKEAATIVPALANPQDVFSDESYSPSSVASVGLTLVEYLVSNGGPARFGELIKSLESGTAMNDAINKCYGMDCAALGSRFREALKGN